MWILVVLFLLATTAAALAVDCPAGIKSCKVLIIAPEEEQALTAPNGILDTAERARFLDLSTAVRYFRDKIANAPAGEVKPVQAPGEPAKP